MPCDNTCKNYLKSTVNTVVSGRTLMIGDVFCRKEKRKLTIIEATYVLAPSWCPNGIDKGCSVCGKILTVTDAGGSHSKRPALCQPCQEASDAHKKKKKQPEVQVPAQAAPLPPPTASVPAKEVNVAGVDVPVGKEIGEVQELVARLNQYRDEYYNKNAPSVTDPEYDCLFNDLKRKEAETGYVMSTSPTQTVGLKVVSELEKITHTVPLLSLDPNCGQPTRVEITTDDGKEVERLRWENPECESKTLRKFVHFVGQMAMDIEDLSGATLEQFMEQGLLETFIDIYHLDKYRDEIVEMDGFGDKSFERLWDAIQASRNTTFDRYVISMDIPMIGRRASAKLNRQFNGSLGTFEAAVNDGFDFTQIPGFGEVYHSNIHDWFKNEENRLLWKELQKEMNIPNSSGTSTATTAAPATPASIGNFFVGKTIVTTGKFTHFSRSGINAKIESLGAKAGDPVSKKTDYLIYGDKAGGKLDKAREFGVTILSEQEFLEMVGA